MKLKSIMKARTPMVEAGSYLAVCIGVLAIGEQYVDRSAFGGRSDYETQVVFVFELPAEIGEDGKPKQLNKEVNAVSSANGNLNKILTSWNSRPYTRDQLEEADLYAQLGKPCNITVEVSESGYSKVTTVGAVPKGIPSPQTNTPYITFNIEEWDDTAFAALPEWAQNKIKNSTQYQKDHVPVQNVSVTPEIATSPAAPRNDNVSGGAPF